MYLIPWLGPQVTPAISTFEVPGPIEMQSSPVHSNHVIILSWLLI